MASREYQILIVDDHPIVRRGLAQLVSLEPDLEVCAEASDGTEALDALAEHVPDLVIVDLELEGVSGLDVVKQLRGHFGKLPILVLSMHDENLYAERALRAGAQGYIMKQERPDEVIGAIREVLAGEVYVSDSVASKLLRRVTDGYGAEGATPVDTLSDRELEVLQLIGQGYRTRHIAEKLYLSPKTIEAYKARIKKKLLLRDASELARYATEWVQTGR